MISSISFHSEPTPNAPTVNAIAPNAPIGAARTMMPIILKNIVDPELQRLEASNTAGLAISDFKSALQEALQSAGKPQPSYVVTREEGPDHRKQFTVEARILPRVGGAPEYVARASASTKKQAEQLAAEQALEHLCSHPLVHEQAE